MSEVLRNIDPAKQVEGLYGHFRISVFNALDFEQVRGIAQPYIDVRIPETLAPHVDHAVNNWGEDNKATLDLGWVELSDNTGPIWQDTVQVVPHKGEMRVARILPNGSTASFMPHGEMFFNAVKSSIVRDRVSETI